MHHVDDVGGPLQTNKPTKVTHLLIKYLYIKVALISKIHKNNWEYV